jgi:hypothetical protein
MPIAMGGALWMDGSTVSLQLVAPSGLLYSVELPLVVLMAQLDDGEVVRFTYDRRDPETGAMHSGAARLVLENLPDPRETEEQPITPEVAAIMYDVIKKAEEQPPAADATAHSSNCMQRAEQHDAHAWSVNEHTYQCDGASAYASRPTLGICDEALKILGVNPYDYTGGANFRDSGGIPPRPSGLMVPPLPYSPPREG